MLTEDTAASLAAKVEAAAVAGKWFAQLPMAARAALLEQLAQAVRAQAEALGELITLEGGKTAKEGQGEAESASDVLLKTIKDASLPEFGGMLRRKERPPVGLVGLITSFNFPLVVANWTVAPALLAGNAVLWKPSEKTPLTALAYKHIFDNVMGEYRDILQVLVGGRSVGEGLVSHPAVGMISATGSVAMGRGIKAALANKPVVHPPILELGGNNGVVISEKISEEHAQWAVNSLMNSFLGTSGQRCTNTRRLIVHVSQLDAVIATLKRHITIFMNSGMVANPLTGESNAYGYGPLIDAAAFALFEKAKAEVVKAGGSVWGGKRIMEKDFPEGFYVEPALAVMPAQSGVMLEETFAPLLYVVAYKGGIDEAAALLNAPENAGLVSGIYTLSQQEADRFAALSEAGHVVINSPKGTGTPAFGMGFGGNKASGEGEILNAADPLRAFTKDTHYRRVAQYQDVVMSFS
jgi:aldehyde dehydrogenase (NAD+)